MLTAETLAELRRLLDESGYDHSEPLRDWMMGHLAGRTHAHLVDGAVNALPDLLDAAAERDALAEEADGWRHLADVRAAKIERVRALHYAADNDAARTPICETCHGKAGVHECGCWADRDREPVCGHCMDGWHGASVPWPCPTIRALDGEAGHE